MLRYFRRSSEGLAGEIAVSVYIAISGCAFGAVAFSLFMNATAYSFMLFSYFIPP